MFERAKTVSIVPKRWWSSPRASHATGLTGGHCVYWLEDHLDANEIPTVAHRGPAALAGRAFILCFRMYLLMWSAASCRMMTGCIMISS
jgi:hypothetical protein